MDEIDILVLMRSRGFEVRISGVEIKSPNREMRGLMGRASDNGFCAIFGPDTSVNFETVDDKMKCKTGDGAPSELLAFLLKRMADK